MPDFSMKLSGEVKTFIFYHKLIDFSFKDLYVLIFLFILK